jgi:hypothetical protein
MSVDPWAELLPAPKNIRAPGPRIGITVRLPEAVHERLRLLAFEQRRSKKALIEAGVAERLSPEPRSAPGGGCR